MTATIILIVCVALWALGLATVRHIRHRTLRENVEAYLYLVPAAAVLGTFWFLPVIFSVVVSFTNWQGAATLDMVKVNGVANYQRAFQESEFWQILFNTINYVIYSVPLTVAAALGVAMLLNNRVIGRGLFRTVFFLPFVTTWVAISIVFKYVFNEQFGLVNWALMQFGIAPLGWLQESRGIYQMMLQGMGVTFDGPLHPLLAGPSLAMFTVILTSVWRDIGYVMVIFLAGLQNIDRSYYEAAEIDGASKAQQFRNVTWPLLSPTTFFVLIISMIAAFKIFVPMYIMTPTGGPSRTTETLVFYLYKTGFMGSRELGYASAVAYILFGIILLLSWVQHTFIGKKVHYD